MVHILQYLVFLRSFTTKNIYSYLHSQSTSTSNQLRTKKKSLENWILSSDVKLFHWRLKLIGLQLILDSDNSSWWSRFFGMYIYYQCICKLSSLNIRFLFVHFLIIFSCWLSYMQAINYFWYSSKHSFLIWKLNRS